MFKSMFKWTARFKNPSINEQKRRVWENHTHKRNSLKWYDCCYEENVSVVSKCWKAKREYEIAINRTRKIDIKTNVKWNQIFENCWIIWEIKTAKNLSSKISINLRKTQKVNWPNEDRAVPKSKSHSWRTVKIWETQLKS